MPPPSLVLQTTYAELLERCASAAFETSFVLGGAFTRKTINGRRYWYFQSTVDGARTQRYVGPETPDLVRQIEAHKELRDDARERRALASTLVRSFGMPQPIPEIGAVIGALAGAGVFRLRGVLVGTIAYQTYSAMLGLKLPVPTLHTGDIDIAQFTNVSAAVDDRTPPMIEVLKQADKTFRPVPTMYREQVTSYVAKGGLRVDFLTPNQGPDNDQPQRLAALQTDAQPLRFLDFLIREPESAVLLYASGIYVNVPTPARYAVHKLIVARRRPEGAAKRDKDMQQAEALLTILIKKRPHELKATWDEAYKRGKEWRRLLQEGATLLGPSLREKLVSIVGRIPGVPH
jgi:hypothetical protein